MAISYVNILASALQEYQTGIPVAEGQSPNQIYVDLAWGGLEGTPPYNLKPQSEKDRIQARVKAEDTGNPQVANGITYSPISEQCN